ncbi:hypothetical protein Aduo_007567 [Ancylostoma duodenale]
MDPLDESAERIMERVRQRNMEISASMEEENENSSMRIEFSEKSSDNSSRVLSKQMPVDVPSASPLKNKTNNATSDPTSSPTKTPSSRVKSRWSELAAAYEEFEHDQNWQPPGAKPKEAYMKGASPRLSMGETRASVLCTPAGMAQLKSSNTAKSPSSKETSPLKPVTVTCNKTPQKLEPVKEEQRRIHFAQPISATHVMTDESSLCSTINTDESTILAGAPPIPAARSFYKNKDGEVDLSNDEYGAHTFTKKSTTSVFIKDKEEQVDLSSDEYGAHTFLKKKTPPRPKSSSSSSINIISPKPFNPVTTSSPNLEKRTITMETKMTTEIPISDVRLRPTENRKDFMDVLESRAKSATIPAPITPKSPLVKSASEESESTLTQMSPIRTAVMESAKAKKIAKQLEEKLKNTLNKIPTPKPIVTIPTTTITHTAPITPTTPRVQTQWRGAQNTPVVVGSTPGVPTQPDVHAGSVKSLKNRWEFSSITGTPIHPDETEDDILKAAIRMRDTSIPRKFDHKPKNPQPYLAKKVAQKIKQNEQRSPTCSPLSKSPRYADESDENEEPNLANQPKPSLKHAYSPYKSPAIKMSPRRKSPKITPHKSPLHIQKPDTAEEANLFGDDEESNDEINVTNNASHLIDQAFEFMERTPNKCSGTTPTRIPEGLAPHAEEEMFSPVKQPSQSLPVPPERDPVFIPSESCVNNDRGDEETSKASLLPYTVSFYRKRIREMRSADTGVEKIDLTTDVSTVPQQTVIGGGSYDDDDESKQARAERKATMEREVSVQQQRIAQAMQALRYCKERTEFRGSREEVDAQRALLIATETRRALLFEIDRLNRGESKGTSGPHGTLSITNITVFLDREFVNTQINYSSHRDDIYYFIVLLRYGCDVQHTSLVTSDEGIRKKGLLEFNYYLTLKDLPPDFVCALEVYGLRTKREHISHEVKYRLGGTLSKKQRTKFSTLKTSLGGPSAIVEPAFQLVGRLTIDINTQNRKLTLQDVMAPLEGTVVVKMKKHATDKSRTIHRGFLSMYQRTRDGLGTWTRYWCVLEGGEMRFWRSPDEERDEKQWLVLLDLQTCAGDGASTVNDVCPYPNSFHIDVWVPKEGAPRQSNGKPEVEKLRVMLAADTKAHLDSWLEIINQTARHVLMWDRPSFIPK